MPENEDNKQAAEEQAVKIAEDGRWAATEGDDNAIYTSDENYVGTEPERQNYAYETDKPLAAEVGDDATDAQKAEKELFDRVAEENAVLASTGTTVTRRGTFSEGVVHPTERGDRPGFVQGSNREGVDTDPTKARSTSADRETGKQENPSDTNPAMKAEVAKGNTPAPAKAPAKD